MRAPHASPAACIGPGDHANARWDDKAERVVFERQEPPAQPAEPEKPDAANVAEAEILFRSALMGTVDSEARQELEANHRRDLSQFGSARDRRIETARKAGESS